MKTVDDYLNEVDYKYLNSDSYVPTRFSLEFMNFVKSISGEENLNKTPPVHLAMLDKLVNRTGNLVVNLAHRGIAKTSLFGEFLVFYAAVFHKLPKMPEVDVMLFMGDSIENGAKSLRLNLESRYNKSEFLQKYLPPKGCKFTDNLIEFTNIKGEKFALRLFGTTSSFRGVKVYGKRPQLAIIDDIFTDDAARSPTVRSALKDVVYNGLMNALDPKNHLVIFSGTPFNKGDLLIEAIESGVWDVNVWPICEKFPCSKEEFQGSWPDRFPYEVVKAKYDLAIGVGKKSAFYQENMLRLSSDEDRLITPEDIGWYSRKSLINNLSYYNLYITTDFATSSKNSADYSVISVWAYGSNGDWFYIDGQAVKQDMGKNVDDLFKYVSMYSPIQSVGIEVTGQQGGFIPWIQKEMIDRNIWFDIARQQGTNTLGIRPTTDKLSRFNLVVPWFKLGKVKFPIEYKDTPTLKEFMAELALVTQNGIKGKDDCLDTISMLSFIKTFKPNLAAPSTNTKNSRVVSKDIWDDFDYFNKSYSAKESYLV